MARREGGIRVKGAVVKVGQLYCVDVPREAAELLQIQPSGGGSRIAVRASIGSASAQTSLMRRRDGDYRLFLPAELRRAASVGAEDDVEVRVTCDASDGEPELPPDLLAALSEVRRGLDKLAARSPADRRQLRRWIESARGVDTRARRIRQAVERVVAGPPSRAGKGRRE